MRTRPASRAVLLTALLLLGACADTPDEYPPLADLQGEVEQLRATSLPTLVPTGFAEVEIALSRAERALGNVELPEIRHLTALAETRLETARAEGEAAAARAEREQLLEERRAILGSARARQLETGSAAPDGPRDAGPQPRGPALGP